MVLSSIRFAVMSSNRFRNRVSLSAALAILPLMLGATIASAVTVKDDVSLPLESGDAAVAPEADTEGTGESGSSANDAVPQSGSAGTGDELSQDNDLSQDMDEGIDDQYAGTKAVADPNPCGIPKANYNGKFKGEVRLGGTDRYKTNAAIAKAVKSVARGNERAVFIASGTVHADGLAVGALAANTGWPLMLVGKNQITSDVAAEIKKVNPTHIYVAGGTGAVSEAIVGQVQALGAEGAKVTRWAGTDRYETAMEISGCFAKGSPAVLATGSDFADAVVAGPAAAKLGGPIVLTPTGELNARSSSALHSLQPASVSIIGGRWSSTVQQKIKSASGTNSLKVYSGSDRYETSAKVADSLFANSVDAAYANGTSFPDSLSGVSAAAAIKAPIILTKSDCRPKAISATVKKRTGAKILLGGSQVVSTKSYSTECVAAPKPATQTVAAVAMSLVGSKANSGSAATNPTNGFDCSGFTQYVHRQVGKSIPRTTWAQWSAGTPVSTPTAGDVIVMTSGSHVGIYMGGGMIVDSPGYAGAKVQYRPVWGPISGYVRF